MTKVVITAAGKGTRLLPFTKEMPKEMMPIFSNTFANGNNLVPFPAAVITTLVTKIHS